MTLRFYFIEVSQELNPFVSVADSDLNLAFLAACYRLILVAAPAANSSSVRCPVFEEHHYC